MSAGWECVGLDQGLPQDLPPHSPLPQFLLGKERESGPASQVAFGLIPLMELISPSCHSHESSPGSQPSPSQPTSHGGHGVLPWRSGPTRTPLALSGLTALPTAPHPLALMRPLPCHKPSRRDRSTRSTDHAAWTMDGWGSRARSLP